MLTPQQADSILNNELTYRTSRSGGKGGQNVNKVETRVQLAFNVCESDVLTEQQKQIILHKHKNLTEGCIINTVSSEYRTQTGNKKRATDKLLTLLVKLLTPVTKRKATKPGKASKEKKLKNKRLHSEKKTLRQKIR